MEAVSLGSGEAKNKVSCLFSPFWPMKLIISYFQIQKGNKNHLYKLCFDDLQSFASLIDPNLLSHT